MLPHILRGTATNYPAQDVSGAEVEKPWTVGKETFCRGNSRGALSVPEFLNRGAVGMRSGVAISCLKSVSPL